NYLREKKNICGSLSLPPVALPSTVQTAYGIAVTEIVKWLVCRKNKEIEGQVMSLDVLSFAKNNHRLVRRPQCPRCGNSTVVATNQSDPLVLQNCRKTCAVDGGHQVFSPAEIVEGLAHHISPITGIVSLLQPNTAWSGERSLTPSYI